MGREQAIELIKKLCVLLLFACVRACACATLRYWNPVTILFIEFELFMMLIDAVAKCWPMIRNSPVYVR